VTGKRGRRRKQLLDDLGLRRRETRNLKRKLQVACHGEMSCEETLDLYAQDRLLN